MSRDSELGGEVGRLSFSRTAPAVFFAIVLVVMAYFYLIYDGQLPDHYLISGWNDLILHTAAFWLLSLFAFAVQGLRLQVLVILVAIAAAFEGGQAFIPSREVAVSDLLANLLGVILAASSVFVVSLCCDRFRTTD